MGEIRNVYKILVKIPEHKSAWESLTQTVRILTFSLKKHSMSMWTGFIWLRRGTGLGFIKSQEFFWDS
jgi:hypothetical protein